MFVPLEPHSSHSFFLSLHPPRLCLHLLLKLFKSVDSLQPLFYSLGSPQPMPRPSTHASGIKYSCDRHLLYSAHRTITVGAIIAILKIIILMSDKSKPKGGSGADGGSKMEEDDFGLGLSAVPAGRSLESLTLPEFAKHTLKQICAQEWVKARCLQVGRGDFII